MKTAIVTGASSGIGRAITKILLEEGYLVYGFGRHFRDSDDSERLKKYEFDLKDVQKLITEVNKIQKCQKVNLLINNAGVGYFAPHEELNTAKIHEMVSVNLEIPMLLTQMLLRDLKKNKGTIINISSITAKKSNTHGCVYGATKAGLSNFSQSLFDETRKYGVKVVTIHPDMSKTDFYRNADFDVGITEDTYMNPEEIADMVKWVLEKRDGIVVTDLTVRPQYHKLTKGIRRE